jgi:hypothetical protein
MYLSSYTSGGELVAFNTGPDGAAYFVIALKPLDCRIERSGWASFVKTIPNQPQTYRVVGMRGDEAILDVMIEGERFNIHDIQPLLDELLLVCARSYCKGPDDFEKNGRVYSGMGKFAREILLGDGIKDTQATASGVIWTSFFDEGVFGNYGWQNPVGASGLVAWDGNGKKLYEFQRTDGLDAICDCYAMNVEAEHRIWIYYYTEFPLVLLDSRSIQSIWKMPHGGSDAFAISGNHALFRGGYKNRDLYQLFSLERDGTVALLAKIELRNENGERLIAERVVGRGDAIRFVSGQKMYQLDVQAALAA